MSEMERRLAETMREYRAGLTVDPDAWNRLQARLGSRARRRWRAFVGPMAAAAVTAATVTMAVVAGSHQPRVPHPATRSAAPVVSPPRVQQPGVVRLDPLPGHPGVTTYVWGGNVPLKKGHGTGALEKAVGDVALCQLDRPPAKATISSDCEMLQQSAPPYEEVGGASISGGYVVFGIAQSRVATIIAEVRGGQPVRASLVTPPGVAGRMWQLGLPADTPGIGKPGYSKVIQVVARDAKGRKLSSHALLIGSTPVLPFSLHGSPTTLFESGGWRLNAVHNLGFVEFQAVATTPGRGAAGRIGHIVAVGRDTLSGQFGDTVLFGHVWWFGVVRKGAVRVTIRLADGRTIAARCGAGSPQARCVDPPWSDAPVRLFAVELPQDLYGMNKPIPKGTATAYAAGGRGIAVSSLGY
jgi:hypothetical protein